MTERVLRKWQEKLADLRDMKARGDLTRDWGECSLINAQNIVDDLTTALAANTQEAWVAALLNAPNPEQATAPAVSENEKWRSWREYGGIAYGEEARKAATPAVGLKAPSRIERAKAIRKEKQCSLQEAVRLERAEFLTAKIQSVSSIEDLKTILLSIVNYRHSA